MLKEFDWSELLSAQRKLDLYTFQKKGLDYQVTFEKRVLSLLVELHELANETKAFKFWSNINEGEKGKVLMEYADVLHFTLSTFCSRGAEQIEGVGYYENLEKKDVEFLTSYFIALSRDFSIIADRMLRVENRGTTPDQEVTKGLKEWLQKFVNLSGYIGYSWKEVVEWYWKKWNINIARQDSGKY